MAAPAHAPAGPESLAWLGVARLAELLRSGQLSPGEVLADCLVGIERLDPQLNAFVAVLRESALVQAELSDRRLEAGAPGPLEGVPIAIKDNRAVAGFPTTMGSAAAPTGVASRDSEVVARLRAAGAILIGKTTLPEFGAIPVTESVRLGQSRNPWSPSHTPGGSSGGSAAAVAAGMVPAAEGNDAGGSLRIPGSCCGLFALKPTRGRIPLGEQGGDGLGGLGVDGFLTRSVADSALLLDVVAGSSLGEPCPVAPPPISFSAAVASPPRRLRVGFTTLPPIDVPVHPACESATTSAAKLLERLGHQVDRVEPGWRLPEAALDFRLLWAVAMDLARRSAGSEGGDSRQLEPHVRYLAELGAGLSATDFLLVRQRLQLFGSSISWLWRRYDVVLTPTLAQPPLAIGELLAGSDIHPELAPQRSDRFSPFSTVANLTGQPAAQLPLHQHQGLPIGVQLIGRYGDEATLLQLSQTLEGASSWLDARPPPVFPDRA
ncbi:MAG: amidase [Candidatus Dormibacteria bacterium]